MNLEQVIALVEEGFVRHNMTGMNALTEWSKVEAARWAWIEHQMFPDLPVTCIVDRLLGDRNRISSTEREFWNSHGLSVSDMLCEHCGAALTYAERVGWERSVNDNPRLGPWCEVCWRSYGISVFGWQAGVPEPRPTYTEARQQWKDRAKR